MATTARNNLVQNIGSERKSPYKVTTGGTADINQGDYVYLDTSTHTVKSVASDANAQYFVGVAADTSFRNLYGTKEYPNSATIQVYEAGIFSFFQTSGDTYTDGNGVWFATDAQTVTNTKGGSSYVLGVVKLRPGITSLAYTALATVDVQIVPQYPYKYAL